MKINQEDLGALLKSKRSTVSNWEGRNSTPDFETLLKIAQIFEVTLDALIYRDLEKERFHPDYKHAAKELRIERKHYADPSGANILVPVAAQAGYAAEWSQEAWSEARLVELPGIEGEARTWEVAGDSMMPLIAPGDWVCGKRVAEARDLIGGAVYVLVTRSQGIHIKLAAWQGDRYLCTPANGRYEPYALEAEEVREIWDVRLRITRNVLIPPVYADPKAGEVYLPVFRIGGSGGEERKG